MTTTAHPWMAPPRPALIPIRLHCRRCLTTELFCPRCGTGLLFTGPASHVATNHLLRRDCINCGAPLGVVLDGYSADASSPEPCPSGLVAHPPEPEKLTMPEPAQRQQLSLPVVLTPEPAPPAATTASQQEQRSSSRRAMPLRSWWQIGDPAATRDGATVAAAYRAIYGNKPPKKQNCNVYFSSELDAVSKYMSSEKWTESTLQEKALILSTHQARGSQTSTP